MSTHLRHGEKDDSKKYSHRRQFGVTRIAVVFRQLTILLNVIVDCGAKSCVDYAESSGFCLLPFTSGGIEASSLDGILGD